LVYLLNIVRLLPYFQKDFLNIFSIKTPLI
jgi:hypothetical protein